MIARLKQLLLTASSGAADAPSSRHQMAVAATALMVQLARVDQHQDERELKTIVDCAMTSLSITREEAEQILEDALHQANSATSLYEFTGLLNDQLDQDHKLVLLESIWRVAYADGRIDQYEEQLIRRMADLLYLHHSEYMLARHRAERAHQQAQG
ncbi:tellurite resistance TerB family protein [Marinobacter zhejiangensis]|uniref:Uncharacterized conserved protein, tellurite resistance protein B (TerB) family n=1 Tax=Marinobacter zhejiangensis TaxID=488535 RepID=A0A1I4NSQ1_9GAMM|nr:TerB family tellurite resistance protein [Marinobacter zhejiangensis]SFM18558.1 Uncharacterized conserved protein, tellurite resistance protein B (TerB) family [Marinobacter zhejiangensis]